jgi:hypothetical protein
MFRTMSRLFLAAMVVSLTGVVSQAQQSTTSSTQTKSFEVLAVQGNQLVVRLPEGTRELTVPDDFRFNIDGQQMAVRELKVGMKGTATITTRTTVTPVTVTEVKNGTVMQSSGSSIIVRTAEGIKMFSQGDIDKRGVKIVKNGEPAQISDFRQGDQLSATIITSKPPQVMTERQVNATLAKGAAPASGATPAAGAAGAGAAPAQSAQSSRSTAASSGTTGAGTTRSLPKTASSWPILGLVSALSLAMGLVLTIRRRVLG